MKKQDEQAYKQTEAFILEKEKEEKEWNTKYKPDKVEYMRKIEQALRRGDEKSKKTLLQIFQNEEFIQTYKTETEIAYMILIMQIYERECKNNEKSTILDLGCSYEEIKTKLQELKFYLWRIEFIQEWRGEAEMLVEFTQRYKISPDMMQGMVYSTCVDKRKVLLQLSAVFIEHHMLRLAFRMLEFLNELSPGNEETLCMLAELCGYIGNQERMEEYLQQVIAPGEMTKGIREKYE